MHKELLKLKGIIGFPIIFGFNCINNCLLGQLARDISES